MPELFSKIPERFLPATPPSVASLINAHSTRHIILFLLLLSGWHFAHLHAFAHANDSRGSPAESASGFPYDGTLSMGWQARTAAGTSGSMPFWLHSNQYGELDKRSQNAVLNLHGEWRYRFNSGITLTSGTDLLVRGSGESEVRFQEAYLGVEYGHFVLTGGRKRERFGLVAHDMSIGSFIASKNARPIPKISFATNGHRAVPGTAGYLYYNASLAHGWMDDNEYRYVNDELLPRFRFVDGVKLHQKHLYLRIFSDGAPVELHGGLVHFAQWGGYSPVFGQAPESFSNYLDVFFGRASDSKEVIGGGETPNAFQNHIGSYDFSIVSNIRGYQFGLIWQIILEDTPNARFAGLRDGLWGGYLRRTGSDRPLISGMSYEYVSTRYHLTGNRDWEPAYVNYYNHYAYRGGWTYHGRAIGNPLYFSEDQYLGVSNNKLLGHHLTIIGHVGPVRFRTHATYSRNYGAQRVDRPDGVRFNNFFDRKDQWSFLIDLKTKFAGHYTAGIKLAADSGDAYKNNIGLQLSLSALF